MTRLSRCAAASGNRVRPFGREASRSTSSTVCIHAAAADVGEIHPDVELQRSIQWAPEQAFELAVDAVAGEHHAELRASRSPEDVGRFSWHEHRSLRPRGVDLVAPSAPGTDGAGERDVDVVVAGLGGAHADLRPVPQVARRQAAHVQGVQLHLQRRRPFEDLQMVWQEDVGRDP